MTTRNKRKLAALNKENCEEHPRSNLAQNSSAPRSQEDYITQVSEEIEGRVTKRLSKEFSRTENRILGSLARLDDFLMNPLLQGHSGTTPEPSRIALNTSQGTNEDNSQNDPHPEAGLFHGQTTQNSGPEEGHDTRWSILAKPDNHFKSRTKVSFTTATTAFWTLSSSTGNISSASLWMISDMLFSLIWVRQLSVNRYMKRMVCDKCFFLGSNKSIFLPLTTILACHSRSGLNTFCE